MKLVMTIVRDGDAGRVLDALIAQEYRATRINTAGGFLKRGNATLLIGVEDDQVDEVIGIVKSTCRETGAGSEAGSGVLFVLPVATTFRA